MADTKTIVTSCTIHGRNEQGGKVVHPPGTPVTLPVTEANRVLAIFGGSEHVPNSAAADKGDAGDGLESMTVATLRALAEEKGYDLGDATRKDDIIAAIRLARGE